VPFLERYRRRGSKPEVSGEDRVRHYRLTKEVFRQSARDKQGFYDAKPGRGLRHSFWQRRVRQIALSLVGELLDRDSRIRDVVDVGCGRGDFTRELAGRYPSLREAWGTDFSPETLAIAAEDAKPSDRVRFRTADLLEMPFGEDRFDLLVCLNVLHHIHPDDRDTAFGELARITRRYILLELKNRGNPYYRLIRSRITDSGERIRVFPMSVGDVTGRLRPHGFRLSRQRGLAFSGRLSPLLVLVYEKGA
jgi:SAM-dependent methyltransferase